MGHRILVTGSAGFIGSHVCDQIAGGNGGRHIFGLDLTASPVPRGSFCADVRCPDQLQRIAGEVQPDTVIHLAAKAEVVIPFEEWADLIVTNVNGTINVLDAICPARVVFASSSAVYGNATSRAALARWSSVNPLGAYGLSKVAAEFACVEWVRKTGCAAVSLRFGNVIGKRCRGLIPYLVDHALQYPDGHPAARLRGGGRIVRDYIPVSYAAKVIELAAGIPLRSGAWLILNVGSGRGTTNGAVAAIIQRVLLGRGYKLAVEFSDSVAPGEASRLVLDTTATTRKLGLGAPTEDEVTEAIEEAALGYLAPID